MSAGNNIERVVVRNAAGEAAPPYAIAEISSAEDSGGESRLVIRKPTGSGQVVAVGPAGIAAGGIGYAFRGTPFALVGTATVGTVCKATSGSWVATTGGAGSSVEVLGDARASGANTAARCLIAEGGGGATAVGRGVVAEGTRAAWRDSSDVLETDGEILAWPFTPAPHWTPDTKYAVGDVMRLTAPAWSDETAYALGDLCVHNGIVRCCTTATGPDAEFPASDFASCGADDAGHRATEASSGTVASPATYDPTEWADVDATRWIDRYDADPDAAPGYFDLATNYSAGDLALLYGSAWSNTGTYSLGVVVSSGGNVYRCTTATGPDAEFPADDFSLIGATASIWRAKVDTGTGPFDYREWRPVTPVVSLRHGLTYKDVTAGSYVAWVGREAVVMHCDPMEGWV